MYYSIKFSKGIKGCTVTINIPVSLPYLALPPCLTLILLEIFYMYVISQFPNYFHYKKEKGVMLGRENGFFLGAWIVLTCFF